jgi:hypothetical protein
MLLLVIVYIELLILDRIYNITITTQKKKLISDDGFELNLL